MTSFLFFIIPLIIIIIVINAIVIIANVIFICVEDLSSGVLMFDSAGPQRRPLQAKINVALQPFARETNVTPFIFFTVSLSGFETDALLLCLKGVSPCSHVCVLVVPLVRSLESIL